MTLRVLHIIDSLARGGAETSLAALAPHFRARGVDLSVAYLVERDGLRAQLEAAGATVVSLDGGGGRRAAFRRARGLVADLRPDLVHTALFEADLIGRPAGRLARVPVVSSLVNDAYGAGQAADPGLRRWKLQGARLADAATARLVTRFHALSGGVAKAMTVRLRLPAGRVEVVPRGRDERVLGAPGAARRLRVRASLGLDPEVPVVLAAARHERQKGLDVLLEAFPGVLRRVPDAQLVVAGRRGHQTAQLEAMAGRADLAGRVKFLGARGDVPDLLCAADVLAFPTRWEGFGGVLLEALALELPIVTSDLPVLREVVDETCATLVASERPAALAHALARVLTEPAAAEARARVGRARFLADFAIEPVTDRMVALYGRAVA